MKVGDQVKIKGSKYTRIVTFVDNENQVVWSKRKGSNVEVGNQFKDIEQTSIIDPRVEATV